jgi:hypothetical protein
VSRFLIGLFDVVFAPLTTLPPIAGLAMVALVVAVAALLIFRYASNQPEIAKVRRAIKAGLFEIRLFNDDPIAMLRVQADMARHSMRYLRLTLVPSIWLVVPLLIVAPHLQAYYGYAGLRPGEPALLKVRAANPAGGGRPDVSLSAPAGLRVESPGVWAPSLGETAWRVAAAEHGIHTVSVAAGSVEILKTIDASDGTARRSPVRTREVAEAFFYSSEPRVPEGAAVVRVEIAYPAAAVGFLGLEANWMVWFAVLTFGFVLGLRRLFGVEI